MRTRKLKYAAIFIITILVLTSSSDIGAVENKKELQFVKRVYQVMFSFDENRQDFGKKFLGKFKKIFDFNTFSQRAMRDVKKKISPLDYKRISKLFEEVFYENFSKNAQKIKKRQVFSPRYSVKDVELKYVVINVSGYNEKGNSTISFYVQKSQSKNLTLIDIAVEGALLSRNYRGSFNRIFNEKGYQGLWKSLMDKKQELLAL